MHSKTIERLRHEHEFIDLESIRDGRRRVSIVIVLTVVTMALEIAAGTVFNSMALLADGWHMASHAGSLGIALFAYVYAQRHAANPSFTFGTGKVEYLGAFASAVALAMVAVLIAWDSLSRLLAPLTIRYDEAMAVAALGLVVNLVCAAILHGGTGGHTHDHPHDHPVSHAAGEAHGSGPHHTDQNRRAAYLHVLADALTSILAIAALLMGRLFGWAWLDAVIGMVGAAMIARWAVTLMRDSARVLVDGDVDAHTVERVRRLIESDADNKISDLHIWKIGAGHLGAVISVVTHHQRPPAHYKALLKEVRDLSHVTVEILPCEEEACMSND
ncbi:CDF family Co(II)/Ni(II) efflux transporter DmeF [Varunaivibrio sulfuroxidans]|uniref:Cation diffusion facilitator family transporter n=1 Tax=Varunaivibrio sulfuroxidans TaxID=1773489 RepID=A0A4R3J8N3_9PROT|nr:CDF family Co(II)/Ni(II) efflux transporter DmeF [Varunaivibrio sulfuroxidans]TCS61286.1 cation diffusion facilitator family transporter [Varunaivibrio sulfuroxidans]WES31097.1 CDF family Co(II)/Ni(II) efflux transporter DmeF [Varunaivibrio sulfuroxidans]